MHTRYPDGGLYNIASSLWLQLFAEFTQAGLPSLYNYYS